MLSSRLGVILGTSFSKTGEILFRPFSAKKWLKLAFIGFFAGAMSFGFNLGGQGGDSASTKKVETTASTSVSTTTAVAKAPGTVTAAPAVSSPSSPAKNSQVPAGKVWLLIAAVVAGVVIFMLVLSWLNARFTFVWFSAIVRNESSIVEPFHRHRKEGNSFFLASLVIGAIFFALAGSTVFWGLFNALSGGAFKPGFAWSFASALRFFVGPLVSLIVILIVTFVLSVAINHFVVMVMAMDRISFWPALRKTFGILGANLKETLIFFVLIFAFWIAASALFLALVIAFIIAAILVGLLVFGVGFFVIVSILKLKWAFVFYAVVCAVPFILSVALFLFCAALPMAVFFRRFSVEYFCAMNSGYGPENLAQYGLQRCDERSRRFLWFPVAFVTLLPIVAILGLLAAIAIPNFVRARDQARSQALAGSQKAAAVSAPAPVPAANTKQ